MDSCVGMLQAVQSKCNGSGVRKRSTQSILLKDGMREVFGEPHRENCIINSKYNGGVIEMIIHRCLDSLVFPAWHNLESSGKKETQLNSILHQTDLRRPCLGS